MQQAAGKRIKKKEAGMTDLSGYGYRGIKIKRHGNKRVRLQWDSEITEKKEVYAGRAEWCGNKRDRWKR